MTKRAQLPVNERLRSDPTDPISCDLRKRPVQNWKGFPIPIFPLLIEAQNLNKRLWSYGRTVVRSYYYQSSRLYKYKYTTESDPLEYCYLTNDEIAMRLRVLSNNILLDRHSFCRFRACVPSGHRTKAGLTKFIMDDFG